MSSFRKHACKALIDAAKGHTNGVATPLSESSALGLVRWGAALWRLAMTMTMTMTELGTGVECKR